MRTCNGRGCISACNGLGGCLPMEGLPRGCLCSWGVCQGGGCQVAVYHTASPETAIEAGATHPTGMPSCLKKQTNIIFGKYLNFDAFICKWLSLLFLFYSVQKHVLMFLLKLFWSSLCKPFLPTRKARNQKSERCASYWNAFLLINYKCSSASSGLHSVRVQQLHALLLCIWHFTTTSTVIVPN